MHHPILNDPNTEYLDRWPTLTMPHTDWLGTSTEIPKKLAEANWDLKRYLGESYPIYRERWLEARQLKGRLSHSPSYQKEMQKKGDLIWLIMSQSYCPSPERMTPYENE